MTDPTHAFDPNRTVLLVMDYQPGILGSLPDADVLLGRAADTIALLREHGGTIGYVRVAFDDTDIVAMPATNKMAARLAGSSRALHSDSPATAVHERIAPQAGDVLVRKTRVGAFSTTDLDDQLRVRGIDTLLLAGVSTSGVVLSTVRDAADRDYRVVVLADLCADSDPEVHAILTERVFPRQADVITTADLPARLASR
jgi:nicotinamidase-related amidase